MISFWTMTTVTNIQINVKRHFISVCENSKMNSTLSKLWLDLWFNFYFKSKGFLKIYCYDIHLTLFFIVHHSQKDHGGNESDDDERDQEHPVHHHGNLLPFVPGSSEWPRFVAKVELFRLSDLVYFIGDIQWDVGTLCSFLQVHGWQVEYRCFISILIVGILPNILKQKAVHDDFSCAKYNKSVKDIWTKIF